MAKKTSQTQQESKVDTDEGNELENKLNEAFKKNTHIFISYSGRTDKTQLMQSILDLYRSESKELEFIDFHQSAENREEKVKTFQKFLSTITKSNRPLILFDTFEKLDSDSLDAKKYSFDKSSLERSLKFLSDNDKSKANTFVLDSTDLFALNELTPEYLIKKVAPYIYAIGEIQHLIDEIRISKTRSIKINSITQNSPISVNLEGAPEAVKLVQESVIPWKRKHAEAMAQLNEQEKLAEIEIKKAEILEKRSNAAKNRAEAEKTASEAAVQREQAEKMKLENEKLRMELHRQKIQLALDLLEKLSPHLGEADRAIYLVKLLPHLNVILESPLEITRVA